jgi:hypothetical protein
MLKVILAKIGISLFHCLPLEKTVAKLLTGVIQKLPASCRVIGLVARLRKTVTHRNELTALIRPRLDGMVRPDALKSGFPVGFPHFFNRFQPVAGAIVSIVINNGACNRMNRRLRHVVYGINLNRMGISASLIMAKQRLKPAGCLKPAEQWHRYPGKKIGIRAEDEAWLGVNPVARGQWFRVGSAPGACHRIQHKWVYACGFVHPSCPSSHGRHSLIYRSSLSFI